MSPNLRSNSDKAEDIVSFIKSAEFQQIIKSIISSEVSVLKEEISALKTEVQILKQSNIELIGLLTNDQMNDSGTLRKNFQNTIPQSTSNVRTTHAIKKPSTFAEKVKPSKNDTTQNKNVSDSNLEKINIIGSAPENWQPVERKTRKKKISNTTYGSAEDSSIKGATLFSHFHVTGLEPNITEEDVVNYLKEKSIVDVKCEKMVAKRPEEYSSFKLSVPVIYKEQITSSNTWPLYVRLNPFLQRLAKRSEKK